MDWPAAVDAFTQLIEEEEKHILFIKRVLDTLEERRPEKLVNMADREIAKG